MGLDHTGGLTAEGEILKLSADVASRLNFNLAKVDANLIGMVIQDLLDLDFVSWTEVIGHVVGKGSLAKN